MEFFMRTLVCLAFLSLPLPVSAEPLSAEALASLSGTWASSAPEPWYGGFGTREFVFTGGQWQLIFTHALDRDMTQRTFQFRTGGDYRVGAAGPEGSFATDFDEDWKHLTLFLTDPAMVTAFGMSECGLTANLEADISETGCAAWRPVEVCGTDHDILKVEGDAMFFGVRPADNDMCSPDKRPTALLPAVVRQ
jgi:hypothetical protein